MFGGGGVLRSSMSAAIPGADHSSKNGYYSLTQFKLMIILLNAHQGASLSIKIVVGKRSITYGEIPGWDDTPSSSNWADTPGD